MMILENARLDETIEAGIQYLRRHQYPNGEFCAYTASDDAMQLNCVPDSNVFPTALISHALLFLADHSTVDEILTRSAAFLERNMLPHGVWQHYTPAHAFHSLISPDVDDTAMISSFLEKRGNLRIREGNSRLLLSNRNRDGLFYTWFVIRARPVRNRAYWKLVLPKLLSPLRTYLFWKQMECERNDVDAVVNANAIYYLGECEETDAAIEYLIRIVKQGREEDCDKWYRSVFKVLYFISRLNNECTRRIEVIRQEVIERIQNKQNDDGSFGESALDTALAISTLLNFGCSEDRIAEAVRFLMTSQCETGEWDRRIFYYGGPKKRIGWGSEEMSTAFCLEALARSRSITKEWPER